MRQGDKKAYFDMCKREVLVNVWVFFMLFVHASHHCVCACVCWIKFGGYLPKLGKLPNSRNWGKNGEVQLTICYPVMETGIISF